MKEEFVGKLFGKDGHLQVLEWTGKRVSGSKSFPVKCSVCANDPELFGDGIFYSTKGDLIIGGTPCGCSSQPRWTKEQTLIRLQRMCQEKYEVVSFDENWAGAKTKTTIKCLIDGHTWTTTISSILRGSGCKQCSNLKCAKRLTKGDEEDIQDFVKTGVFLPGCEFWRSHKVCPLRTSRKYWNYTCPVCSYDEFVKGGVCSGIFEAFSGSLKRGHVACRCSKSTKYTQEQMIFKINKRAKDIGYTFVSFVENYKGKETKALLKCDKDHVYTGVTGQFIYNGYKCPSCSQFGYKSELPAALYVIKAVSPYSEFTGYGISNIVDTRMKDHKRNLLKRGFVISEMEIFHSSNGKLILDVETTIKSSFPCLPQTVEGFKKEATHAYLYDDIVKLAEELTQQ